MLSNLIYISKKSTCYLFQVQHLSLRSRFFAKHLEQPGRNSFTSDFLNFDSMSIADINTTIIEGYLQMLDNLSPSNKLDLISKLSASVKSDIRNKKSTFKRAFGAFQSDKSADEIMNEIRSSRTFNRQIEEF